MITREMALEFIIMKMAQFFKVCTKMIKRMDSEFLVLLKELNSEAAGRMIF